MRPGRLSRKVTVPLPGEAARAEILGVHLRRVPLASQHDRELACEAVAKITAGGSVGGWVGAGGAVDGGGGVWVDNRLSKGGRQSQRLANAAFVSWGSLPTWKRTALTLLPMPLLPPPPATPPPFPHSAAAHHSAPRCPPPSRHPALPPPSQASAAPSWPTSSTRPRSSLCAPAATPWACQSSWRRCSARGGCAVRAAFGCRIAHAVWRAVWAVCRCHVVAAWAV